MILNLLVIGVSSQLVLTSQWMGTECQSSADAIYLWNLSNNSTRAPGNTTRWPVGYQFQAVNRPFNLQCFGTLKVPLTRSCCAVSLNMVSSANWTAASTVAADLQDPLAVAPATSINTRYCALEAVVLNRTTLFGMRQAYYRANDQCITPDSVRCGENGELKVYSLPNCAGTVTTRNLDSEFQSFSASSIGSVRGRMITQTKGNSTFSWTILVPSTSYMPNFRVWNDWMFVILYFVGISLLLFTCWIHLAHFWRHKTPHRAMIFFSQVIWLLYLILKLSSSFGGFNRLFDAFNFLLQMLGSLLAVFTTLHFLLNAFKMERKWYYAAYISATLVHGALNWNNYTRFDASVSVIFTRDLVAITTRKNLAWLIIMFVLDMVPPLYVVWKLLQSFDCSWVDKFHAVLTTDKQFVLIVELQFVTLFFFVVQDQLRSNSELLGHDRVWISMQAADAFTMAIHCLLNSLLADKMTQIVKEKRLLKAIKPKKVDQAQEFAAVSMKNHCMSEDQVKTH